MMIIKVNLLLAGDFCTYSNEEQYLIALFGNTFNLLPGLGIGSQILKLLSEVC